MSKNIKNENKGINIYGGITIEALEKLLEESEINSALYLVDDAVKKISHVTAFRKKEDYTTEYAALEKVFELFAKAISLGGKTTVKEIFMDDDDFSSDCELKNRLGAIATKLIVPEYFFTDDMAQDIIRMTNNYYNNENKLFGIKEERQLLIDTLVDQFDIFEETAKIRLKQVDLSQYDNYDYEALKSFYHEYELYYKDDKEASKEDPVISKN